MLFTSHPVCPSSDGELVGIHVVMAVTMATTATHINSDQVSHGEML